MERNCHQCSELPIESLSTNAQKSEGFHRHRGWEVELVGQHQAFQTFKDWPPKPGRSGGTTHCKTLTDSRPQILRKTRQKLLDFKWKELPNLLKGKLDLVETGLHFCLFLMWSKEKRSVLKLIWKIVWRHSSSEGQNFFTEGIRRLLQKCGTVI